VIRVLGLLAAQLLVATVASALEQFSSLPITGASDVIELKDLVKNDECVGYVEFRDALRNRDEQDAMICHDLRMRVRVSPCLDEKVTSI
jgi:hypothetical protein